MPEPPEPSANLAIVAIIFGMVFFLLIGLIAWQPQAAVWIANAVETERSVQSRDQAVPIRLAEVPERTPIAPGEWVHVLK
jgi:cytochrome oxidase assembly protein ShyY1